MITDAGVTEIGAPIDGPPMELAPDAVHCWLFNLDREASDVLLDPNERDRAAGFRFDRDRRRFVAGHDATRRILARYVGERPEALTFAVANGGRPSLTGGGVNYSYSRSDGCGLLAISKTNVLGADLEAVRYTDDLGGVAQRMFSPAELAALDRLSGKAWTNGFYNCWTRKEAVVKALGVGLAAPLQSFDVSLCPVAPARILNAKGACAGARSWALQSFNPLDGYRAAIATDIAAPNLHLLRETP